MGRPRADCDSQRNSQNPPHPRGRPVADDMDTVGAVLFCDVGFSQKERVVVVHSDNGKRDRVDSGGVK